jgi:hypothetical protein
VRFTLKPYQSDAVAELLEHLERAQIEWHRDGRVSSTALTATTGAGKTVMAAAVIEALFWGSEQFDFELDEGAVVVWFSDDPSLNLQTRDRLLAASEKFDSSNLVVIEPPFSKPKLEPGKVYFLNTGKLTKNSLLTRGHVADPYEEQIAGLQTTPDMQGWTIWETIANTINDDDRTLYLVLDEAHRGFNTRGNSDKPTIVKRLVNGHAGYPPVPVVWGISATIDRFKQAMTDAEASGDRRALPFVQVDPSRVQESGLVKDTIALNIPDEAGTFDITFVHLAAERLKDSRERWAAYAAAQSEPDTVQPLLILQTPNKPDHDDIGLALDAIAKVLPDVHPANVRHVFGDHTSQKFGAWEVDWIEPQRVEEEKRVTVLVAKDAISTGWDCPRAEVMVSFRPARDNTHITQLLGRMVRSPLARRVPGDERLNAVDCILPFFDRTTAGNVVKYLTGKIDEMPGSTQRKVLLEGKELQPNSAIPESVWALWDTLPSQTMPQRGARPVKRLVALAQALAADGVRPGALAEVNGEMRALLDSFAEQYAGALDQAIKEIWDVHVQEILGKVGGSKLSYNQFVVRADDRAIRTGFQFAKKAFGADVAMAYVDHLAPDDEDDDFIRDAFVKTSALAAMAEVRHKIDIEANRIVDGWYAEHQDAIRMLTDGRQQEYEDIRALAVDPQIGTLHRPRSRMEDYAEVDEHGQVGVAPLMTGHLMSDADGMFPVGTLNAWERKVVGIEMARPGALGWYRNPPRAAVDSLTIAYRDESGNWRSMHPDFVFFHKKNGEVVASVVDPHGHHLDDAELKLRALASFAERCGDRFDRIWAVSAVNGVMRILDAKIPAVREAMKNGEKPPLELYESEISIEYAP